MLDRFKGRLRSIQNIRKQPSIALTLQVKNPRIKKMNLNTVASPAEFSGVFSIDVENTGIFGTPASSISDVDIRVMDGEQGLELIKFAEPKSTGIINPGQQKTIDLEFEVESDFVERVSNTACDSQEIDLDMNLTINELILGVQYATREVVPVKRPNCTTITINVDGPDQVQSGNEHTWTASGNLEDADEIRWDMGDGTTKTGTEVEHSYSSRGDYTVSATAIRSGNEVVSDSMNVSVLLFVL